MRSANMNIRNVLMQSMVMNRRMRSRRPGSRSGGPDEEDLPDEIIQISSIARPTTAASGDRAATTPAT